MLTLFKVLSNLKKESFKKALADCFVQVGLLFVTHSTNKFVPFTYKKKGVMNQLLPPAVNSGDVADTTVAMGEVISEVALKTRPPDPDRDADIDDDADGIQ